MATEQRNPARSAGGNGSETKHAFKTTEFWTFIAVLIAIVIAAGVVGRDARGVDAFPADKAWLYVTILTVGYLVSRGLAKAGSRDPSSQGSGSGMEGGGIGERVSKAVAVLKEGEVPEGHNSPQAPTQPPTHGYTPR